MTQPMDTASAVPQTFTAFCDTLIAALPDPRLIRGHNYLNATWMTTGIHWDLGIDTVDGEIAADLSSIRSATRLQRLNHADDLLVILRALGAIETPQDRTLTLTDPGTNAKGRRLVDIRLDGQLAGYIAVDNPDHFRPVLRLLGPAGAHMAWWLDESHENAKHAFTAAQQAENPTSTGVDPSPVGATSAPVDPTREEIFIAARGVQERTGAMVQTEEPDPQVLLAFQNANLRRDRDQWRELAERRGGQLGRLRTELNLRDWFVPDGLPVDETYVTLALSIADGLGREQARVRTMAYQRGRILELCWAAGSMSQQGEPTWWNLDPTDVVAALGEDHEWPWYGVADPWEAGQTPATLAEKALALAAQLVSYANRTTAEESADDKPLTRGQEMILAAAWEAQQALTTADAGEELDDEDRAMIRLVDFAAADIHAPWVEVLADVLSAMVDGDEEEAEASIARWREATAPTQRPVWTNPDRPGERWDSSVPPGGWVCGTCGTPTESEPCPDHATATDTSKES